MIDPIVHRYRVLRGIASDHANACLRMVARNTLLDTARSIGLARRGALVVYDDGELELLFDLCLHTARHGRSRAIDRFARAAAFRDDSDEALVLRALQGARFSIWRIDRHAPEFGLILQDMMRGGEAWVVDEAMTATAPHGTMFAGRMFTPGPFGMWCGMGTVVTAEVFKETLALLPAALEHTPVAALADDYRFAAAIYAASIGTEALQQVHAVTVPKAA